MGFNQDKMVTIVAMTMTWALMLQEQSRKKLSILEERPT